MAISDKNLQRIGFILVQNFALISYASAIEPFRSANAIAGSTLYNVAALSLGGVPVRSSSGVVVECADVDEADDNLDLVFVCAGTDPAHWVGTRSLEGTLRRLASLGVRIGGISSGAYFLAAAGLLDNHKFTIHWEHAVSLKEAFPNLALQQARYVIDGNRITCAGGVAALDMMHAVIAERMGSQFARRVSDWYLHTAVAEPSAPQRASSAERYGTHHPELIKILEKMEAAIEYPLKRAELARAAGISLRHMDRLFMEQLSSTFLETYRLIRLRHAYRLLEQSPLSVSEIAYATGFCSAAHFSNCFRRLFGAPPKSVRQ